jgi:hypothetical protein
MARRRGERTPVMVLLGTLKYGFQTQKSITTSYGSELGHVAYSPDTGVGIFFGANSPKPPRATKQFDTGAISSFCSTQQIGTLRTGGWTVSSNSSRRGIRSAGKTKSVFVDMPGGYRYAWNISSAEADLASELGFELATGGMSDLVWGSTPKPPRASKVGTDGRISTFCKPQASAIDAAIAKGWTVSGVDYDLLPAAAPEG